MHSTETSTGARRPGASRVMPPVYLLLALVAMTALHFALPLRTLVRSPLGYLGLLPIVAGIAVVLWAARAFGRAGTPIRPFEESTALVSHGLYRYSRNPIYLGMVAVLIGAGLLFGTASPFLVVPLFVAVIQTRFIVHEEAMLEAAFGDEYRAFKRRVRRWI